MEFMNQLAAIGAVLSLLAGVSYLLRRAGLAKGGAPRLALAQRLSIGNGCQLVVVHWDGREILLATGTQNCTVLGTQPAAEPRLQGIERHACAG
jgi:flagellar biogenesis protein FliO